MTEENPYQEQTAANTSTTWLSDQKAVDLDLDGIREYAVNMITIKDNLSSHTGYLNLLQSLPTDAWEGGVLGEGGYVRQQMMNNYGELRAYMSYLGIALDNVGMAARTVADIFSSTDGWSAASLDAVNWAFGDNDAPRPDGVPSYVGATWWDKYFEALNDPNNAPPADSAAWVDQGQVSGPMGMLTQTAHGPNGQVKKVVTFTPPGGGATTVTTTVYNANGDVISETRTSTTSYFDGDTVVTRRTTTDAQGRTTGSQEERTTYENGEVTAESNVNYGADGAETSGTRTETNPDGTTTTTTTRGSGEEQREQTLEVGEETEGVSGVPESPTQETLEDIEQHQYGPGF